MAEPQDVLQALRIALQGKDEHHNQDSTRKFADDTAASAKPEDIISKEKERKKV